MAVVWVAALAGVLLLSACGQVEPASASPELRGRTFLSTSVAPHELVAGTRISLEFTDDGRLVAEAGCNIMNGPVRTSGGRLEASLVTTEMGCDPNRHRQDEWLLGFLSQTPSWRLNGDDLKLSAPGTELDLLDREVATPDVPLTGTVWTVDTLIDGQTASTPPTAARATLRFDGKRVYVSGGCNRGSAAYQRSGSTIRLGDLTMTLMACDPEAMRLEEAVVGVLQGQLSYEIDADRLTLGHPSDTGLVLRAG